MIDIYYLWRKINLIELTYAGTHEKAVVSVDRCQLFVANMKKSLQFDMIHDTKTQTCPAFACGLPGNGRG